MTPLFSAVRHSVRLRLALWHTLALAMLLATFAAGAYVFLTRTTRQRGDRVLSEMVTAFTASWANERDELPDAPIAETALDAMQTARYQDRRILLYGDDGLLVAVSDSTAVSPSIAGARWQHAAESPLSEAVAAVAAARGGAPALTTIGRDDEWVRVHAVRELVAGKPFVVVALRDLRGDDALAETFLNWLTVTLPLALVLSGGGGYLIARRTLMPVVAIARDAEQISAQSLNARLHVQNPTDELGQLAGVLNGLLSRLEVSFDQQKQFMADASHELRTPVAVLRSAADIALANDRRTPDELRQALRLVSGESRRLTRLVEDLFLMARADAGQQPLRVERVYLEELLHDASQAARALAAPREVTIIAEPADESPFEGDEELLTRVLMNLVDNAVRHTPEGGSVTLSLVRASDEAANTRGVATMYNIRVADTGSGIPTETQARIFDRFVRTDRARTRDGRADSGGAGLGLSIARWIAEAHSGSLRLESSSERGSCFVLSLPIQSPTSGGNGAVIASHAAALPRVRQNA